ncbi:MAG: class I SAM-dependent methyltransferase [Bacteroidota bacterium]
MRFAFSVSVLFCSLSILCLVSCEPTYDKATRHHSEHKHDYHDHDHDHDHSHAQNAGGQSISTTDSLEALQPYIDIRDIWQKPEVVLHQLGDLKGKVVADIGAGPYGYFSLRIASQTEAKKVIAIDIDQEALAFIEEARQAFLPANVRDRLEARLVTSNNAKLNPGEVDVVLIVNTAIYFDSRIDYFKNLRTGLAPGGRLVIIDYKKKQTPIGPPVEKRIALGLIEQELLEAGYRLLASDDKTLEFQYIVTAIKS